MGACTFETTAKGATARQAFSAAVAAAQYERGHGGYTGTIAEKSDFVILTPPKGIDADRYVDWLLRHDDMEIVKREVAEAEAKLSESYQASGFGPDARYFVYDKQPVPAEYLAQVHCDRSRVTDKWGPAGAIQLTRDSWLFFGWASS